MTKIVKPRVLSSGTHVFPSEFGLEEWAEPSEAAEEEEAAAAVAAAGGEDDSDMDLTYGEVEQRLDLLQQHLNRWEEGSALFLAPCHWPTGRRARRRRGVVELLETPAGVMTSTHYLPEFVGVALQNLALLTELKLTVVARVRAVSGTSSQFYVSRCSSSWSVRKLEPFCHH